MKISFWITAAVLFCTVRLVFPNNLQVGTVLFTSTDIVKKCWTESDKALLKARLIMQDVLPDPDCLNFSKPGVVPILLDYFQSCYDIIRSSTYGKSQNLMFLALSDAVGGYLRAYILPLSKRAYYAGQVKYSETSKLFELYNDIKMFLKTNGVGWAKPYKLSPLKTIPKPLVITTTGGQMACDDLYIIERKTKFHFNRPQKIRPNLTPKQPVRCEEKTEQTTCSSELYSLSDEKGPTFKELQQLQSILLPNTTDKTTTALPSIDCKLRSMETNTTAAVKREPGLREKRQWKRIFRNESVTDRRLRKRHRRRHTLESMENVSYDRNDSQSAATEDNSPYWKPDDSMVGCLVTFPDDNRDKKVLIPLPVLDDSVTPFTLAVPFKCQPLRSTRGRNSAFILEHYYLSVIKCMISKGSSKREIKQFNGMFFSWLCSEVLPHLDDEVWYPAFGGILRIMETIKKLGADSSVKDPTLNDVGYMFPNKFEFGDSSVKSGKEKTRDVGDVLCEDEHPQSKRFLIYGILVSIVAALFVFWACVFCMQSLKTGKSYRPPVKPTYGSTKTPEPDGGGTDCKRKKSPKKEVCYDGVRMTKAERKILKKAEKRAKRERARELKRQRKKLKRVPDWKELVALHKGGGDRLPLFKLPWTMVRKKHPERGDSTDEDKSSKCMIHDSSMPSWSSQPPFIALQKLGSKLNTSSAPIFTDMRHRPKVCRKPLDRIQLIWKKPSNKSSKTNDDKDTQDTQQLKKASLDSTLESSKDKELLRTIPSDSYTYSVEDERMHHRVKKRYTSHDRSEACPISSRTATTASTETQETSSAESETDDSYSSESESSRRTTKYK